MKQKYLIALLIGSTGAGYAAGRYSWKLPLPQYNWHTELGQVFGDGYEAGAVVDGLLMETCKNDIACVEGYYGSIAEHDLILKNHPGVLTVDPDYKINERFINEARKRGEK